MLRSALLKLSESKKFASWVTTNGITRRMARRFVAGESLDEAIGAARACNGAGMMASLDYLGENVASITDAQHSRDAYLEVFERIAEEKLHANVSCKLTQLGLDINNEFCEGLLISLAERAFGFQSFLRVDMDLLAYGCRIRLCKGAYKESEDIAYPKKEDVDRNYLRLMELLLSSGFYHAIATHDPRMIAATIRFAASKQISKDDFEFQMLYGVRTDLQSRLVKDGYRVRIYIPFGNDWFPYFMRRLAERPANVGFLLRNFLRS